jgi:hypothetical protein
MLNNDRAANVNQIAMGGFRDDEIFSIAIAPV